MKLRKNTEPDLDSRQHIVVQKLGLAQRTALITRRRSAAYFSALVLSGEVCTGTALPSASKTRSVSGFAVETFT